MWNNHQSLNFLSNVLIAGVVFAIIYVIGIRVMASPFFWLQQVRVEVMDSQASNRKQLTHITRNQVEQIVHNLAYGNFMLIDLKRLKKAFMELPWMRSVEIYRDWPPTLNILFEEHKPFAYWGETALVNTKGEVFHAAVENTALPVFTGPAKSSQLITQQYHVFSRLLRPTGYSITEITLTPRHAWHIRLDTGIWLKLGKKQIKHRLQRYVAVHMQHNEDMQAYADSAYVDLRYSNGFAVRIH